MSEGIRTDRESQFTALQLVVSALVQSRKDDPDLKRLLAELTNLDGFSNMSEEDKEKTRLSIRRLTGG